MADNGASRRVGVIGGGVAGLAAAYFLGRAGFRAEVFEADDELGGLARSFDLDGLAVEQYYHFVCLPDHDLIDLAAELGLSSRLHFRPTRTSSYYQGRLYPFTSGLDLLRFAPIPPWSRINLGWKTLQWNRISDWRELDEISAKRWLIEALGEKTYEVIWAPLLTMKFGDYHDQVSAAWLWHRIHRVFKSRRTPLSPQVMGHFEGGTHTLLERLRAEIERQGGAVHCRAAVEAVLAAAGRARGVRAGGREHEFDAVVMAAPLPRAAGLLPAEQDEYRRRLEAVKYIGVVCAVLWLTRGLTDSFWCNIHDDRVPFNGMIEMSRLNPEAGRGGALLYVPYYLRTDAERFGWSDERIFAEVMAALPLIAPEVNAAAVRAHRIFRSPFAQAITPVGFLRNLPGHQTPLPGLYLIDSTQLYPEDRTVSGTIGLARKVSELIAGGPR
jgi:protoporphyrinogen oxidase